jgi:hypothetical protein
MRFLPEAHYKFDATPEWAVAMVGQRFGSHGVFRRNVCAMTAGLTVSQDSGYSKKKQAPSFFFGSLSFSNLP